MRALTAAALFSSLPAGVFGADVLTTSSFSTCLDDSVIDVKALDVSYDKNSHLLTFNVDGESKTAQNVTAKIVVTAYGKEVYTKTFSPCEQGMKEMCPGMRCTPKNIRWTSANKFQFLPQHSNRKAHRPYPTSSPNKSPP
jgi:hypothetical protein